MQIRTLTATISVAITICVTINPLYAHANVYSRRVAREDLCSAIGVMSQVAYNDRVAGISRVALMEKYAKALNVNNKPARLLQLAMDYGYDKAIDTESAYVKAHDHCMDATK